MKSLFDKTNLNGLSLKNRLTRSATGENLATAAGHIPEDLFNIYKELAEGGVGLIITSFTSVAPVDHFNDGLLRLHDDALIPEYGKLVNEIHKHDCIVMPQLALGVYQKPDADNHFVKVGTNEMDKEDIREVIRKFVSATERALKAGFDGVQLHGTHSFVLSKFLSPNHNHRRDEYGGSIKGRAKIILDIIHKIRQISKDLHISIKVNYRDMPANDLLETCRLLVDAGLNSVEYEGYFTDFFPVFQSTVGVPVILTGGLRKLEDINILLNQYGVDYVGMARPLIRESELPNRWREGYTNPAQCISCGRCMTTYGFRCAWQENREVKYKR